VGECAEQESRACADGGSGAGIMASGGGCADGRAEKGAAGGFGTEELCLGGYDCAQEQAGKQERFHIQHLDAKGGFLFGENGVRPMALCTQAENWLMVEW
jgi:hypothetical protein